MSLYKLASALLSPTRVSPEPPPARIASHKPVNPLVKPKGLDRAPPGSPTHFLSQTPLLSAQEIPAILQALEAEAAIGSVLTHEEGLRVLINRFTYDKTSQPFDRPSGPGNTGYVVPPLAYLKQHRARFDRHRPPSPQPPTPTNSTSASSMASPMPHISACEAHSSA